MTAWENQTQVEKWGLFEITLNGPVSGNPFTDVTLSAEFAIGAHAITVRGFYDGGGVYRIRFMPDQEGTWRYVTASNEAALDGCTGSFDCTAPAIANHGPVTVFNAFQFRYADRTPFRPVGTTCYAWVHQGDALARTTLETLKTAPFNKLRMCIFPKHYAYNANEPEHYPFERDSAGNHDFFRPNPAFWRNLERRVTQLMDLGIEADIILFHGYDRWGYAAMSDRQDDFYLTYAVARLAAFRNVWWSVANEFDLMKTKSMDDWHRFFEVIHRCDPYRHLCSIHNGERMYDHGLPWVTHVSLQSTDFESARTWRTRYGKPLVYDECRYEGDIERGWGNLPAEEMTAMFWRSLIAGAYAGHGETYEHPQDILWWSKGGVLLGQSPARIAFFRRYLEQTPEDGLEPINRHCAARHGEQYLYYFDTEAPTTWEFHLPSDRDYTVEIIDTWEMTATVLPEAYSGRFTLTLPGKKYMAVRITVRSLLFPVGGVTATIGGLPYAEDHNTVMFNGETVVELAQPRASEIRYTLDGSEVSCRSPQYRQPLAIARDTLLRAAAFCGNRKSREISYHLIRTPLSPAVSVPDRSPGLRYAYYEGEWTVMPDFRTLTPVREGVVERPSIDIERRKNYFGIVFTGYIAIPYDGVYTFYSVSDDGSLVFVDGRKVVDNDGQHGMREARGQAALKAGMHRFEVHYFDYWYENGLELAWYHERTGRRRITAEMLWH